MSTQYNSNSGVFRFFSLVLLLLLTTLNACTSSSVSQQDKQPIKIGVSVSLTGDFAADGKATLQGYQLWANDINKSGGLLGRSVQLDVASDASSEQQVSTNYQKFITVDHDDLVFGPYSSLLTKPASLVAHRYGYAFVEGAGTGPSVYTRGLNNLFATSLPAVKLLDTTAFYILSLPQSVRPKTAAYATEDDPFAAPQVAEAQKLLEARGIKTVYSTVYPAETTDYSSIAQRIIASHAQVNVMGTFLPDISAFVQAFHQQHYNPQLLVATAGPDQANDFIKAVGLKDTEGIMVPNTWFPQLQTYQNAAMVQEYIAKYGGTIDEVSSDVAQAYSVGQVVAQAVQAIHSLDNAALIKELHTGIFNTTQGPVQFDNSGQNIKGLAYLFQWQGGRIVPIYPTDIKGVNIQNPEFPKPTWA